MKMFNVYPTYDIEIVKALGSKVWDSEGTEYLDMYGGHAVISIGHTHPHYVEMLEGQLSKIGFYSNSVRISLQEELAEKLGRLSGKESYRLFMCNSGAEANENAMKLASFHNGKKKIIAMRGAFHGRTSLAVMATDNPRIQAPVNKTDNIVTVPVNDSDALKAEFDKGDVCAVIMEGIQGVGGVIEAGADFVRLVRSLCDRHNAVFIADDVQCGCGRSGRYFYEDYAGVDADIYTMAKGIGNGFPVGAIAVSPAFEAVYGMLGTTFGGNQLACAAAIAVCDVIERDRLIENAAATGEYLKKELAGIEGIEEVRGRGLMIGIRLPYDTAEVRKKLLFDKRIFVGSSGDKNVFRLLPALNIGHAECDRLLEALKELL
ncbi:MAG: aminotransferase class III-fold pyridoxal phosphate-dependent enzyme [Rikenellaceae bacterium]|nr:aminotransferase class III-fold pyridoxal phosphate-dependent enzyme [Rikenellaceae bacterium]